jgi:uncharacterized membrane protein HdeD (DUF308 family)
MSTSAVPTTPAAPAAPNACVAWQLRWTLVQGVALAALLGGLLLFRPGATRLLFTSPLGVKMSAQGAAVLAGCLLAGLVWARALDWACAGWAGRLVVVKLLGWAQAVVCLSLALSVLVVGPAAIQIMADLSRR